MPKESPTTSSLWAGPTPHAWPWRGALVSSPSGPPCPGVPVPGLAGLREASAAAAGREGGHWHELPPGAVASEEPPGLPRQGGHPITVPGSWEHSGILSPASDPLGSREAPRGQRGGPQQPLEEEEEMLQGEFGGLWQ